MIYKLFLTTTEYLLSRPETGMGFQVISAKITNESLSYKFVVYNAELILNLDDTFEEYRAHVIKEGYDASIIKANKISIQDIQVFSRKQIDEFRFLLESTKREKGRHSGGNGAISNPKIKANGEDFFTRLSAYENDRRIDFENKCLRPGTYTTTLEDYVTCVKYNDDPVDRYALPNDDKVKWAFFIRPKQGELYQEGVVQPAFGHYGGGIEDYFADGTTKGTYLDKLAYGTLE